MQIRIKLCYGTVLCMISVNIMTDYDGVSLNCEYVKYIHMYDIFNYKDHKLFDQNVRKLQMGI